MNGSFFMLLQIFYDLSKKTEEKKVVSLQNKDFVKMCQDPYVIVFSGTFVSRVLLFHVVTVCHVCFLYKRDGILSYSICATALVQVVAFLETVL